MSTSGKFNQDESGKDDDDLVSPHDSNQGSPEDKTSGAGESEEMHDASGADLGTEDNSSSGVPDEGGLDPGGARSDETLVWRAMEQAREGSQPAGDFFDSPFMGDYEILEEIGRGGMGVVFRARELTTGRTVALKMIASGPLAGANERHLFRNEVEAAAMLQHDNIVSIFLVGEFKGQPYFAMQFVDGGDLSDLIGGKPLVPWQAAELAKQIAQAVDYAHRRGVLHRDLKPQNVLIDGRNGRPLVTDFGLAKQIEAGKSFTATNTIIGSAAYMSPEQAEGRNQDISVASDVYGLGATLYEMLTGRPPFSGESPLATLRQISSDTPSSPRSLNSKVDRDLEAICLKCLEKEPERRYASVADFINDVDNYVDDKPLIHARPPKPIERAARWCRKHPGWAATMLLFVLLTVGASAYWYSRPAFLEVGVRPVEAVVTIADQTVTTRDGQGVVSIWPGAHVLQARSAGYRDFQQTVTLQRGTANPRLNIDLRSSFGRAVVDSRPSFARVEVRDLAGQVVAEGATPFHSPPLEGGAYKLRISRELYDQVTLDVDVPDGNELIDLGTVQLESKLLTQRRDGSVWSDWKERDKAWRQQVQEILSQPFQANFVETPLHDVIELVNDKQGLNIFINRSALRDIGIGSDEPITMDWNRGSFLAFLERLRRERGLVFRFADAHDPHVIEITTPEEYDWRDAILGSKLPPRFWGNIGGAGVSDPERSRQIAKLLQTQFSASFFETPLEQVTEHVESVLDVEVYLDQRLLAGTGIGSDTITINWRRGSFGGFLRAVLYGSDLTFSFPDPYDHRVICITDYGEEDLTTVAYYVEDLVADSPFLDVDRITNLIKAALRPTTWEDVGGSGVIKEFPHGGAIAVSATEDVHLEVEELLGQLRRVSAERDQRQDPSPWGLDEVSWKTIRDLGKLLARPISRPWTFKDAPLPNVLKTIAADEDINISVTGQNSNEFRNPKTVRITFTTTTGELGKTLQSLLDTAELDFAIWLDENEDFVFGICEDRYEMSGYAERDLAINELAYPTWGLGRSLQPIVEEIKNNVVADWDKGGIFVEELDPMWRETIGPQSLMFGDNLGMFSPREVPYMFVRQDLRSFVETMNFLQAIRGSRPANTSSWQGSAEDVGVANREALLAGKWAARLSDLERAIRNQTVSQGEETRILADELRNKFFSLANDAIGTEARRRIGAVANTFRWPIDMLERKDDDAAGVPDEVVQVLGESRLTHWAAVHSLSYTPDGKWIVSAGDDHDVCIWDAGTGHLVRSLKGHRDAVRCAAASPDGKLLATGGDDNTIIVWRLEDGSILRRIHDPLGPVTVVSFVRGSTTLASGRRDSLVSLWDVRTGQELDSLRSRLSRFDTLLVGDMGTLWLIGSNTDDRGNWLGTGGQSFELWNLSEPQSPKLMSTGGEWLKKVLAEPEKHGVVAGRGFKARKQLALTGDQQKVHSVSDDGKNITTWDGSKWEDVALSPAVSTSRGRILSLASHPEASILAWSSEDGSIELRDLRDESKETPASTTTGGPFTFISVSRDGTRVLAGGPTTYPCVFDIQTGKTVRQFASTCRAAAMHPEGKHVILSQPNGQLAVHSLSDREKKTLPAHVLEATHIVYSSSSSQFATASWGIVKLWDSATNELLHTFEQGATTTTLAFSPDGQRIAVGCIDGSVNVWNTETGELVEGAVSTPLETWSLSHDVVQPNDASESDTWITSLAFASDGEFLARGHSDGTLTLQTRGRPLRLPGGVFNVDSDLNSDDREGSSRPQYASRSVRTGSPITAIDYSANGELIGTAHTNGTVQVWDAQSGRRTRRIQVGPKGGIVWAVKFTPEGRHLVTGNGNGTAYVVRFEEFSAR